MPKSLGSHLLKWGDRTMQDIIWNFSWTLTGTLFQVCVRRMEVWTEQTGITIFIYSQLFFCLIIGFLFRTKIRKKCSSNSSSSFFTESYWKSSENNHFWFLLFCFLFGKYQNFAIQKKQLPETLITTVKTASNN